MRVFVYCFFLLLFLMSCKSLDYSSSEYYNSSGYKSFYVVDTIKISNPIMFLTDKGRQFVMSKSVFDSCNCDEESLLLNPDAFLLEDYIPFFLPYEMHIKYVSDSEYFAYNNPIKSTKKGVDLIFTYSKEPVFFLLTFIRGDYYNYACTGIDGPPPIKMKNFNLLFYRVVIPFYANSSGKKQEKSDTEFITFANRCYFSSYGL